MKKSDRLLTLLHMHIAEISGSFLRVLPFKICESSCQTRNTARFINPTEIPFILLSKTLFRFLWWIHDTVGTKRRKVGTFRKNYIEDWRCYNILQECFYYYLEKSVI